MRQVLLYPKYKDLAWATQNLTDTLTSPCFLVLCNSSQATVIEKDLGGQPETRIRTSESFIVQANHDNPVVNAVGEMQAPVVASMGPGMDTTVVRSDCVQGKWDELGRKSVTKRARDGKDGGGDKKLTVKEETLVEWMIASPVMNEYTQFGCILDPSTAKIRWLARGDE